MDCAERKHINAPTTVYAVAKLAETVLKRDAESLKSIGREHPEVQELRELCKDSDVLISASACQALVTLVEAGVLSIPNTLSTFIAILPYCSTYVGITSALGQMLILDMKMRAESQKKYKCPFNLQSPQHPLLTVLKQQKNSWHHIINQIIYLCTHEDEMIQENSSELVRPVVLFIMCNPGQKNTPLSIYQQQLWTMLLSLPDTSLLEMCLPWLILNDIKNIQHFYIQLASSIRLRNLENSLLSSPNIILELAGLVHTLVSQGEDPRVMLAAINDNLSSCCTFTGSCVIMILAHTIVTSPVTYLLSIMSLCFKILKQKLCASLPGKMLTASILPWLAHPSVLTVGFVKEAQCLLQEVDNLSGVTMTQAPILSHSSPIAHLCIHMCHSVMRWTNDPRSLSQWLKCNTSMPASVRAEYCLLLGAVVIQESTSCSLLTECLNFLLSVTRESPELGTSVLTWILFRLSREKEPGSQLELLRALPCIGSQKENVAMVIHTLESLKISLAIRPLILNLYLKLWRCEPRCFPYLQKILEEALPGNLSQSIQQQWNIARAFTMKEICQISPSQHGKELVPLLCNILNSCMDDHGAVASSLSLQAIAMLCRAKIVDVATTWKVLAPNLSRDVRIQVIKGLCEVLGLISDIRSSNPDQSKLFKDAQSKLWSYVVQHNNLEVKAAALEALSQFSLEQLNLKTMPTSYRQNLKLPPEYAKTPIDAARKPEDVLPYIPGECWPQLLAVVPIAESLVKILLTAEVTTMRGALHRPPGKAESALPVLPRNSVCLGLISHLRRHADSLDAAAVPCLKVLSSLGQPLPPCDWSFLSVLASHKDCTLLCLRLAASQAHCSPSAQTVADTLVQNMSTDPKHNGFSMLGQLCKGVPPRTLRPFIETALQASLTAIENKDNHDTSSFQELMGHIKCALQRDDIHDANRTLLSIIIEGLLEQISIDNEEVFSCYVECVAELSSKFLERMSSPSNWWEVTSVKLQKAIAIRSYIAVLSDTDAPLVWLNECIEAAIAHPREQQLLLRKLQRVLVVSRGKSTTKDWLLELMGRVQASLTSKDKQAEASFLCDVFALSVIVLSGHTCLHQESDVIAEHQETRFLLLPQALYTLLKQTELVTMCSQVIEWLHHLIKSVVISPHTKESLYQCLQALRHTEPMQQMGVWQRVVS